METKTKTKTQNPPPGYNLSTSQKTLHFHQIIVLLLTFTSYATFHASRKPPSIVKSVLGPESPEFNTNSSQNHTGWPPFDGKQGTHRLGELDLAFLSSYSIGMYFAGHFGDRIDLRVFLTLGMVSSGVMTVVFGFGYWLGIHKLGFFMVVQIVSGVFQSIGWPCVISVIGNWFGKSKRGLIMGIWSSNTSVGNIIGSVVASSVLEYGWGWSFVVPGMLIIVVGIFVFLFLVVNPEDAGFESPGKEIEMKMSSPVEDEDEENVEKGDNDKEDEVVGLIQSDSLNVDSVDLSASTSAIGFIEAWKLPGVAPYAFCLFFSKLVAYTFLYWLPFYIRHTEVAGVRLSHKTAGILSTMFDLGGVVGGISAGYISDAIEARAVTSIAFLFFSIPALVLYRVYGSISMHTNIGLMLLSGLLVNGPYALITTAVAADLGTQSVIKGNSRALATVTAIIDGTGSVGAALGPLLTGYISSRGWNSVFAMLIVSIFCAGLFLIRLAKAEITSKLGEKKWFWQTS